MGLFSRFKNVSKKSSFQMITDVGNGFYVWNGKLYQSDIVRSCIRPKTKAKSTYFNQIAAMTDTSGQPIARVNAGVSGKPEYRILGRPVNFVSSEYMSDFSSTVSADTVVAFMFRMEDYILNTNLNVTVKRYEDHETDDQVTKAIMMADGKVVDNNSLVEVIQKNL